MEKVGYEMPPGLMPFLELQQTFLEVIGEDYDSTAVLESRIYLILRYNSFSMPRRWTRFSWPFIFCLAIGITLCYLNQPDISPHLC